MPPFVKNPNYSPYDPNSKRYVSAADATTEAQKKAAAQNDLFSTFGVNKTADPLSFFNPANLGLDSISSKLNTTMGVSTPATTQPRISMADLLKKTPAGPIQSPYTPAPKPPAPQQGPTLPAKIPTPAGNIPQGAGTVPPAQPQGAEQPVKTGAPEGADLAAIIKAVGQAGGSINDMKDILSAFSTPGTEKTTEIRNKLGIPGLVDEAFTKPEKTTLDTYKELYSLGGLGEIKDKIKAIDDKVEAKKKDLLTAMGDLKSNPWLSAATREGRLGELQALAYADISNDLEQKQNYLDLYDQGVGEIEQQITLGSADQKTSRDMTIEKLNYLLGEAEREQKQAETETFTKGLRYVPDFLKGVTAKEDAATARTISEKTADARLAAQAQRDPIASMGGSAGAPADIYSPEYIQSALTNSAGAKGRLGVDERQNLNKLMSVIGQAGNLIGTLKTTDTGPMLGALKSLNPYDFDARAVNAQIQALVPNVARGVYGEVGVLTDTDIQNYIKTLPNLKSTTEQNKFVAALTLKNAQRNLESFLLNAASSNVDVSGFIPQYNYVKKQVSDLESQLGIQGGAAAGAKPTKADADYVASLKL